MASVKPTPKAKPRAKVKIGGLASNENPAEQHHRTMLERLDPHMNKINDLHVGITSNFAIFEEIIADFEKDHHITNGDITPFIKEFNITRHHINELQLFITEALITNKFSQQELDAAQKRLTTIRNKLNKIGKKFIGAVKIVKMIDNQYLVNTQVTRSSFAN